ncbi:MAG TPA: alpha/beta hydrolase [Anaerolineae bacterium]|nr:alpha/beta hydrolase [Anaerolineae bacterium]
MGLLTSNPKIARLYDQVPEESLQRLRAFRQRYPMQTMTIGGRTWRFIDTREGESALFIPAGGTTIAEVSFASLSHFAQRYRVISPDYPPIDTMQEFLDGTLQLLDRLGVGSFTAMGGSYGGWMVQSLVRHCPERVHKAVITVIGPPNPENSRQLAKMMPLFRVVPMFLLRAMISRSFSRLESSDIDDPDLELLWALVKEAMYFRVKRGDLIAAMKRLVDQTENYSFASDDLKDWPGSMLMLFGSEDPSTPAEVRQAMRMLYPQAEMVVFEGGEHGIGLTHKQAYYAAIDAFLAG